MSGTPSIHTLLVRGVEQVVPGAENLAKLLKEKKIRVYLGIDPTGAVLTLGHGVVLKKLQQFAEAGHEVILLIGNGTVRIGDPTGRDSTRPVLTDQIIEENFKNWKAQAEKILDFDKITIKHNGDWLDKLSYADIVKLLAKTTVQQLLERDMFQDRLQKGLPIHGHEIMYPLLQGYDSVAMDVDLEIGGSDQLFNMMMGRQLQRDFNNREKWVLTTPIINGTDGRKMSKSFGNFIALTENPTDMYGKLMRVADTEIVTYLTILTDIADEEVEKIMDDLKRGGNPMEAKKLMAHSITTWLHGKEAADGAAKHFQQTVQLKQAPEEMLRVHVPARASLIEICKLCQPNTSKSELKRVIEQGGVELVSATQIMTDPFALIAVDEELVLRIGKRNFYQLIQDK